MARKAMMEAVNSSNRYPWETTTQLRQKIGFIVQFVNKDNVTIGAGSSELLGVVSVMVALQKGNAVAPDPTFPIVDAGCKKNGAADKTGSAYCCKNH